MWGQPRPQLETRISFPEFVAAAVVVAFSAKDREEMCAGVFSLYLTSRRSGVSTNSVIRGFVCECARSIICPPSSINVFCRAARRRRRHHRHTYLVFVLDDVDVAVRGLQGQDPLYKMNGYLCITNLPTTSSKLRVPLLVQVPFPPLLRPRSRR